MGASFFLLLFFPSNSQNPLAGSKSPLFTPFGFFFFFSCLYSIVSPLIDAFGTIDWQSVRGGRNLAIFATPVARRLKTRNVLRKACLDTFD